MTSKSILVTGGAGYVGAHCCKALREAGFTPVVFDNLTTGHREFVKWGPFVHGDIRDAEAVSEAIAAHKIEAVLHFAASAYVGESLAQPRKYYENNVAGSLALLNGMLKAGCRRIVFSSTCAIYGSPLEQPIRETAPKSPINPYGRTKLMVETILSDYASANTLDFVALRYFNASGADPESQLGELRDPETHLIPRAMMAIQGYVTDFAVYGDNYQTFDGTAIRDYIHVVDLADAHVAALARLLSGGSSGSFNLGTGIGYSVKQVIEAIEAETGARIPITIGPAREGDPPMLVADASLAEVELGSTPKLSNLQNIVRTAWAWHQKAHPTKTPTNAGRLNARMR